MATILDHFIPGWSLVGVEIRREPLTLDDDADPRDFPDCAGKDRCIFKLQAGEAIIIVEDEAGDQYRVYASGYPERGEVVLVQPAGDPPVVVDPQLSPSMKWVFKRVTVEPFVPQEAAGSWWPLVAGASLVLAGVVSAAVSR